MPVGPPIPEWADPGDLAPAVRQALRGLEPRNAEHVAVHLVAAGSLVDECPEEALAHARAARDRASRIAVVREAVGVAAYHAGDFAEAARELRAYRRMSGDQGYRAVLADCERALGRPEIALRLVREGLEARPDAAETVELRLVEAGARQDLGEVPAARLVLEGALGGRADPVDVDLTAPGIRRLATAYADLLTASRDDARAARWRDAVAAHTTDDADVEFLEEEDVELVPGPSIEASADEVGDEAAGTASEPVDDHRTAAPDMRRPHELGNAGGGVLDEGRRDDTRRDEGLRDAALRDEDVEAEVAELLGEAGAPNDDRHS